MCGGASKPSRLRRVGPTFARPALGKSTLKRTLSGRPGPPIATGTCARAQTEKVNQYGQGTTHTQAHTGSLVAKGCLRPAACKQAAAAHLKNTFENARS